MLRKRQYEFSESEAASVTIAVSVLLGKIANCRKVIERALRDHAMLVDVRCAEQSLQLSKQTLSAIQACNTTVELLAFEGNAAKTYFNVFDQLILQQREDFLFQRTLAPPATGQYESLLSFLYTLLTNEIASALEAVGLDPYVGFLHADRPGRPSLALDLMEELRPVFADRLALSLVNRKQITAKASPRRRAAAFSWMTIRAKRC